MGRKRGQKNHPSEIRNYAIMLSEENPSLPMTKIAEITGAEFGIDLPWGTVKYWLNTADKPKLTRKVNSEPVSENNISTDSTENSSAITSLSSRITTVDQLVKHCEIDLKEWEIERKVINKWEVGAKHPKTGSIIVEPLFQIKLWLRRRIAEQAVENFINECIDRLSKHSVNYLSGVKHEVNPLRRDPDALLEISIPDLHIGQRNWAAETGQPYDVREAVALYCDAAAALAEQARSFSSVDQILLVVGNDFLNVDTLSKTTTKGTPQDQSAEWFEAFLAGQQAIVHTVDMLFETAPVEVMFVRGNHDNVGVMALSQVIKAWYRAEKRITINDSPALRKYFEWGTNLIGFTHGNLEKNTILPMVMAQEVPEAWARTTVREFHLGHHHRKHQIKFKPFDEFSGVMIRHLPSLAPPSAWANSKGWRNIRQAEAFLWCKQDGQFARFSVKV